MTVCCGFRSVWPPMTSTLFGWVGARLEIDDGLQVVSSAALLMRRTDVSDRGSGRTPAAAAAALALAFEWRRFLLDEATVPPEEFPTIVGS